MSERADQTSVASPQPESTRLANEPQPAAVSASPQDDSFLYRLRLFLWVQHQPAIAGLLLACIVGMSAYFVHRNHVHNGLIEIDRSGSLQAEFQVDINEAQFGEIVILPGVGEKLAQTIVDHRQQAGPFDSVQSLTQVPGIGEKKLEALIPFIAPIADSD